MLTPNPFYFLRHGETDWNKLRLMQGQTDTALNATGVFQSEAVAAFLAKRKIVTICTSPLRRAKHTADIVAKHVPRAAMIEIDGLKESHFGSYEGHPSGTWRDDWIKGAELPGGEMFSDFLERCLGAVNQALTYPGPVLIVSHGGVFNAVRHWAQKAPPGRTGNCDLFALTPPKSLDEGWRLKRLFTADGLEAAVV